MMVGRLGGGEPLKGGKPGKMANSRRQCSEEEIRRKTFASLSPKCISIGIRTSNHGDG